MVVWTEEKINEALSLLGENDTVAEVCIEMGVTPSALRSAFQRHGLDSPSSYLGQNFRFAGDSSWRNNTQDGKDDSQDGYNPDDDMEGVIHSFKKRYYYNETGDQYVFWLKCRNGYTDIIDGEMIRAAKRMYSRWEESGPENTINEICRKMNWPRAFFVELKQELGWTHDQDPFTSEEHVEKDTPEIMKDLEMMRRDQLERERNKIKWQRIEDEARNWREFDQEFLKPMFETVKSVPLSRVEREPYSRGESEYLVVFTPFDAHVDGLGWDGKGMGALRDNLLWTTEKLLNQLRDYEGHCEVDLALGSDWWNVDTETGTTTLGTLQVNDGFPRHGLLFGLDLQIELAEMIATLGPTRVRVVPGNHDRRTCMAAWWGLNQRYRNEDWITVDPNYEEFHYRRFGQTLVGWHHGDGRRGQKDVNYALRMPRKAKKDYALSEHHYQIVGHRHHFTANDPGIIVLQTPSIAHTDLYHRNKMYDLSRRGQAAFTFSKDAGLEEVNFAWLTDED